MYISNDNRYLLSFAWYNGIWNPQFTNHICTYLVLLCRWKYEAESWTTRSPASCEHAFLKEDDRRQISDYFTRKRSKEIKLFLFSVKRPSFALLIFYSAINSLKYAYVMTLKFSSQSWNLLLYFFFFVKLTFYFLFPGL